MSSLWQLRKLVTAIRLRASEGKPIPPTMWGRADTLLQAIWVQLVRP